MLFLVISTFSPRLKQFCWHRSAVIPCTRIRVNCGTGGSCSPQASRNVLHLHGGRKVHEDARSMVQSWMDKLLLGIISVRRRGQPGHWLQRWHQSFIRVQGALHYVWWFRMLLSKQNCVMNLPEKTKQVGGQLVRVLVVFFSLPYSELYVCPKLIILDNFSLLFFFLFFHKAQQKML